jgi:hypothetical protein
MTVEELLDVIVPLTGKDPERVDQALRRGTIVSGSSRFRWDGWKPAPEHVYEWLARYPDPDATVRFDPDKCGGLRLRGPGRPLEISRETATRRRWFRRHSFWAAVTAGAPVSYDTYSYRDRADIFSVPLAEENLASLREAAQLLAFPTLRTSVTAGRWRSMEFLQPR